jgi:hypothetical protein
MKSSTDQHLQNLNEIRSLMERSSRFISLSGFSGVFAGIYALIGAAAAYVYLNIDITSARYYDYARTPEGKPNIDFYTFFFTTAILVLVASIATGIFLTTRRAKKQGLPIWDKSAKRLLLNMMIPLATGGIFCLALVTHGLDGMVAPATLIFYGLALINASKYTLSDIRSLGIAEVIIGLTAAFFMGYGLLFWALGFGIMHIIYGTVMYYKYEK